MDLTLHQLEIFVAVARTRSFTQAAGDLVLTQPVVSRTISQIERRLREELLVRTTRQVELTDAGVEFLAVATRILDTCERGMERFADFRAGERRQVTIAALPSIAAAVLPSALADYLADYPGVQVRLIDATNAQILAALRDGAADVAITEVGPASVDFAVTPLIDDPMVAVVPETHPFVARTDLTWSDLADASFIAFSPDSSIRRLADLGMALAGVQPRSRLETRTIPTAGRLIAEGLGVSAMPALVLPLLAGTPVVSRPLSDPAVVRKIAVHARVDELFPAAVQRLVDHVCRVPIPA